jgi:CRISPR/Cas system endoribonuclease Cas6 (RAMP superfamily)
VAFFIGEILLTVYSEDLLNIIYCVENFNLGKNTSFGMGKYFVKVLQE